MSMNNLAIALWSEGHYAEAEKLYRETLDMRRRVLGPEHPDTLSSMNNLANVLDERGPLCRSGEVGSGNARHLAPCPRSGASGYTDFDEQLGKRSMERGHYAEAEKLDRETLDIRRRVLAGASGHTRVGNSLADVLSGEGHYAEAEKLDRETLDIERLFSGRKVR